MKKRVDTIPTGKLSRTTLTGLSAAKAGIKHISYIGKKKLLGKNQRQGDQEHHEREIGKILYSALSQLRGTALKVAQMLSMEDSLFPEPIRIELSKACHQVLPLNRALIHKVFIQEFHQGYDKLFHSFNAEAFAAASLGQVHEAITNNSEKVAVKVQYPGIASSIKSDIKLIKGMVPAIMATTNMLSKKELFTIALDEIEKRLSEEVDYIHEAQQTHWFLNHVSSKHIKVPEVISEYSSKRILTLRKLPGVHIKEWLKTNPSQKERNHFGQVLFDFFLHTTFNLKKIHADPHPGNFLFSHDETLGILDFGCVKTFENSYLTKIRQVFNAIIKHQHTDNYHEVLQAYQSMFMLHEDISVQTYRKSIAPIIKPMQFWLVEPFCADTFDFGKKSVFPSKAHQEFMRIMPYLSNFHRDQVYFNRFFAGIMSLLKQIGAVVKTSNPWIGYIYDI